MQVIQTRYHLAKILILLFPLLFTSQSWAIVNLGDDFEIEGYVKQMNIIQSHDFFDDAKLTAQRNTAQLEGKYYFLRNGTLFNNWSNNFFDSATFTFLARGVYDSAYDIRDSYDVLEDRGKDEYKIRESFIDFVKAPYSLRIGRQQVVWGETDNFRALDIINPLDLSWHGTRESWEDIRIPLWMARGIMDIGKIGPFDESFLELIFIPDDFEKTKVATKYPRPWAFRGIGLQDVDANSILIGDTLHDLNVTVIDGTPSHNLSNAQGGARFKAIWNDIDFSLNYYYGFSQTPGVKLRSAGLDDMDVFQTVVKTEFPRMHVFGVTANYSDDRYTQSVFRVESTITKGIPVSIAPPGASSSLDSNGDGYDTAKQSVVMLGIDRPTWIPALNKLRTFFLSTQFFWRHYLDYSPHMQGNAFYAVEEAWVNGQVVPDRYVSTNDDKIDQDEFVFTFSASTTYGRAGLWKPLFVFAYDPRSTGAYNKIQVEYLYSKHLVFRAEQHLYWRTSDDDVGPWGLGDYLARPGIRRNETVLTATFQF